MAIKDKLAAKHQHAFAAFFRMQKTLVLRKLKILRNLSVRNNARVRELATPNPFSIDDWKKLWADVVVSTTPALQKIIVAAEVEGLNAGSMGFKYAFQGPEVDPRTFSLSNPRAVNWFRTTGGSLGYIKGIQDTTGARLQTMVEHAIATGQPHTELARDIDKEFKQYAEKLPGKQMSRSQLIAVTEIGQAYEEGNMEFAQSLRDQGVEMEKKWMTSQDDRVSEGCDANMSEDWVEMDYLYGEEGVMQPPRFPGCRCYEIYREVGSEEE